MKVENKTIIITDPCYIINKHEDKKPKWKDYPELAEISPRTKFSDYTPEQTIAYKEYSKAYDEFNAKYDDWSKCSYGENMEALGITNYICRDTIYGDWSCTTYNTDTEEKLGKFCADAGLVAVFELDEVLKYNPDFSQWIKTHNWCVTVIENFTGNINFEVVHQSGVYTKDDEFESNGKIYCKEGETWENDEIQVVGKGNINFFTTQTEL